MDVYLELYLKELYPEFNKWSETPIQVRMEIYSELNDREKAWVQLHLMNNPALAKEIWQSRMCDAVFHHVCPECGERPEVVGGDLDLVCVNLDCPYVKNASDPELAHPWMGNNHVMPSDENCGDYRWDSWDN